MFEHIYAEKFAKELNRELYHISETPDDTLDYLKSYIPPNLPDKWFI